MDGTLLRTPGFPHLGRPARLRTALLAVILTVMAGCGSGVAAGDGDGFLTIADLRTPAITDHFTTSPEQLRAKLSVRANGCVTVVIDEIERFPFWPTGSVVAQTPGSTTAYTVRLPIGVVLHVENGASDVFTAKGIIDTNPTAFGDPQLPGKAASLLNFCGVTAAPVAFPDAGTFAVG
jgi:hypothetical protein